MTLENENHTTEELEVWRLLFERQSSLLHHAACQTFLEGLTALDFQPDAIPHLKSINAKLRDMTGWSLTVVPGIVEDAIFFEMLSHKIFPVTGWLRSKKQLQYIEEPDMFHDVFGHVPMLTDKQFCGFLEGLSRIALAYPNNTFVIERLVRMYWFTVEFGLVREPNNVKICGAGILSSIGETLYCLSGKPPVVEFDLHTVFEMPFRKDRFQDRYVVINDVEQLFRSVYQMEETLLRLQRQIQLQVLSWSC